VVVPADILEPELDKMDSSKRQWRLICENQGPPTAWEDRLPEVQLGRDPRERHKHHLCTVLCTQTGVLRKYRVLYTVE
jgi:hypothetical protein